MPEDDAKPKPTLIDIKGQLAVKNGKFRKDVVVAVNYGYNPRALENMIVNFGDESIIVAEHKFFVAPPSGKPIMPDEPDKMNEFMDNLVDFDCPDRRPFTFGNTAKKGSPQAYSYFRAKMGVLRFDEEVGSVPRTVTSKIESEDQELKKLLGKSMSYSDSETAVAIRRITIFPFYTAEMAKTAGDYSQGYQDAVYYERSYQHDLVLSEFWPQITNRQFELLKQGQNPLPPLQVLTRVPTVNDP